MTVTQLKDLDRELDIRSAPRAHLEVATGFDSTRDALAFHSSFQVAGLRKGFWWDVLRKGEPPRCLDQPLADRRVTGSDARLDESLVLPGL